MCIKEDHFVDGEDGQDDSEEPAAPPDQQPGAQEPAATPPEHADNYPALTPSPLLWSELGASCSCGVVRVVDSEHVAMRGPVSSAIARCAGRPSGVRPSAAACRGSRCLGCAGRAPRSPCGGAASSARVARAARAAPSSSYGTTVSCTPTGCTPTSFDSPRPRRSCNVAPMAHQATMVDGRRMATGRRCDGDPSTARRRRRPSTMACRATLATSPGSPTRAGRRRRRRLPSACAAFSCSSPPAAARPRPRPGPRPRPRPLQRSLRSPQRRRASSRSRAVRRAAAAAARPERRRAVASITRGCARRLRAVLARRRPPRPEAATGAAARLPRDARSSVADPASW